MTDDLSMGEALMLLHYGPMILAAVAWSFRSIEGSSSSAFADLLGFIGIPVALILYSFFARDSGGETENYSAWFSIYSLLSFGTLPIATITLHILIGRLIGRGIRIFVIEGNRPQN